MRTHLPPEYFLSRIPEPKEELFVEENAQAAPSQTPAGQPNKGGQVAIQNIYIKDLSFEAPNSPQIFFEIAQNQPQTEHGFSSEIKKLADNVYEVMLGITVTVTIKEKTAFLVEVKQAGIFTITGFTEDQLNVVANTFCLNTLYPYIREVVSSMVARGGFPPLMLPPINFEARYAQQPAGQTGGAPAPADA
jgi:preprotein translocase subunit SecB